MYGYWYVDRTTVSYDSKGVWSYDLQIQNSIPEPSKTMKGDLMWSSTMIPLVNNQTKLSSSSGGSSTAAVPPCSSSSSSSSSNGNQKARDVTDLIIMLPGNPGVVEWYTEMMNIMSARSGGKVAMLTVGFLGHHSGRVSSGGWNNVARLQDQIESMGHFFKTVIVPSVVQRNSSTTGSPPVRLHVAGHSIGAFVASHMAARFPEIDGRCFLLAPTICNMLPSPNGSRNNKFVNAPTITVFSALAGLISLVTPRAVQKKVVTMVESNALNDSQMEIAMDMGSACPGMLYNMLTMARSEFDELGSIDPHILGMIGGERTVAYFVQHDGWVPLSDVALFRQNCPEGSTVILDEDPAVPHAFVLSHSARVVDQAIAPFIRALRE